MKKLTDFFLTGFRESEVYERRKASYLLYILLCSLGYVLMVIAGQFYFEMGTIYLAGDFIGLGGVLHALWLFRQKKIEAAGHIMAAAAMSMIVVHNVVHDLFITDPAMRYRIYINMVALFGVYYIIISFFRDKRIVYIYGFVFELIILAHALVISHQLRGFPELRSFVWQHFLTAFTGIIAAAVISTWLIDYINALFQQNVEDAQRIRQQNQVLEKLIDERTRELKSTNEDLQEFSYIVSHDLKEPLRTISGFITLLKKELHEKGYKDAKAEEYIDFVTRGTRQMELLISDILSYSKLNVLERQFDKVNMEQVINEAADQLAHSILQTNAKIARQTLLPVTGQKNLLVQLLQNLLSNSLKYQEPGKTPVITINSYSEEDRVVYCVTDNGIGVPEKYFDAIFQPFKRLHSKGLYEGTGIGLALCKKIVEIHGGKIWLTSKEGEGTTFYFSLPKG